MNESEEITEVPHQEADEREQTTIDENAVEVYQPDEVQQLNEEQHLQEETSANEENQHSALEEAANQELP